MATKTCNVCGMTKALDEFYRAAGMRDGHRNDCKACNLAAKKLRYDADPQSHIDRVRRWRQDHAERHNEWQREYRRRPDVQRKARDAYYQRQHGISLDEADAILESQAYRCAICKRESPDRLASMHLDHDHETGRIRGFLCIDCNHGLGKFKDEPSVLLRAAVYLRDHEKPLERHAS